MKDHFPCETQVGLGEEEGEEAVAVRPEGQGELFKPKVSVGTGKTDEPWKTKSSVEWAKKRSVVRITGE